MIIRLYFLVAKRLLEGADVYREEVIGMNTMGRLWGLVGVTAFLSSAVVRLWPSWSEIATANGPVAYAALALLLPALLYLEAYRGFYLGFGPRVVSRSKTLTSGTRFVYRLFAPLYCMGFIGSSLGRKLRLTLLTLCIAGLVFWVRELPQPWRWVIDLSVAVALLGGSLSILWLAYRDWHGERHLRATASSPASPVS